MPDRETSSVIISTTTTTASRGPRIPAATYRLQFNAGFTFRDARAIVDYLHEVGISDCYTSPYLKAAPGSTHGYDVVDPTVLNPEIGTNDEYETWIAALRGLDMGHILDVVANHMGIARSANPWWLDVLEDGPSSRFARFFDIDWFPIKDELANKVLTPILGDQYGAALERQELRLVYRDAAFAVQYYDNVLPVAPDTYAQILAAGLEQASAQGVPEAAAAHLDELRSIITAARHLPPRTTSDPAEIAVRAREKQVVRRRLATLLDQSPPIGALVEAALTYFNGIVGEPRTFDPLDALLHAQSYRLAFWRVASEEINYRRFFEVNNLAALRMEDPEVFEEVHRFILELVARGGVTGLRIDHVDGLFDPSDYLRRLQARAAASLGAGGTASDRPLYLVVEKILGPDEQLPPEWPVHGTTGYEFAVEVNGLFVDARQARAFDDVYGRFAGRRGRFVFDDLAYASKKLVMHETMSGDINALGHRLARYCEANRHFRDFTLYDLISTLKEVIASFPVYRTYVTPDQPISDQDRRHIVLAARRARPRMPHVTRVVLDFVEKLLLREAGSRTPEQLAQRDGFIGKFQQATSPVAAKGIEDTALYSYNRLLSLNEVGSDPTRFGIDPADVHQWMTSRQRLWPAALSATSTHDTKRGEDVRARLNVLSEMPGAWRRALARWRALNRRYKRGVNGAAVPDPNEEYLLYQTLVGVWPFDATEEPALTQRIQAYLQKALREAKDNTSWLSPDEAYETAATEFVAAILDRRRPFLEAFLPFQARVAELGIYNSLAQLLIKATAPGIPDFYQGTELWDLTLVDPDNRRPVDYAHRRRLLATMDSAGTEGLAEALLGRRTDGQVKLFALTRVLRARRAMRALFEEGEYLPLGTAGTHQDRVFAFARRRGDSAAVICVPRLVATLLGDRQTPPVGRDVWGDTTIELPSLVGGPLRDVFTGATHRLDGLDGAEPHKLDAAHVFERFPIALLVPAGVDAAVAVPASRAGS